MCIEVDKNAIMLTSHCHQSINADLVVQLADSGGCFLHDLNMQVQPPKNPTLLVSCLHTAMAMAMAVITTMAIMAMAKNG